MILKKKTELLISNWSGGTTTELFIFPEGSSYKERDFLFRISTSTVDLDESVFTALPGVKRHIMVLDGEMTLFHDDEPPVRLERLQAHSFSGGQKTVSRGRCTDFNLMTTGNADGTITGFIFSEDSVFQAGVDSIMTGIYLFKGEISGRDNMFSMTAGDFLLLEKKEKVIFNVSKASEFVLITVKNVS